MGERRRTADDINRDKTLIVRHRYGRLTTLGPFQYWAGGGGGGTPYDGLYGEAPPERGTFFSLQVYKRVGISQV